MQSKNIRRINVDDNYHYSCKSTFREPEYYFPISFFPNKVKANFTIMENYLNSSASDTHHIIPVLMRYLLTINVSTAKVSTSANTEGSFNKWDLIQNILKQGKRNEDAENELLTSSFLQSFPSIDGFEELQCQTLKDLLDF